LGKEQCYQHELFVKLQEELKSQQIVTKQLKQVEIDLSSERQCLFAQKNPDTEENNLIMLLESTESEYEYNRQKYELVTQKLHTLRNSIEVVDKEIIEQSKLLLEEEEAFNASLIQFGFESENDFIQASLTEQQRSDLIQQEKILQTEQVEVQVKTSNNEMHLTKQLEKKLTDLSIDNLRLDTAKLEKQLKKIQGELGADKEKIANNKQLLKTQQSHLIQIEKQKKEYAQWNLLHQIIGSADGKKYRNFAQGLTFEMMVGHANHQLQKMTQRYLLVRDNQQPLELNVIDSYQAGEIRSTKNLSGGESFIVSLALALGLSQMASQNVKVDSLFLDEGFGTLDENALDTALETLSGLQQSGKLIGIISHVQALKDRIGTQILVSPCEAGRSRISGEGCRYVSA